MRVEHHLLALVRVHVKETALRVIATLVQFVAGEFLVASQALEFDHAGEELPKEVTPRDLLCPKAQHEFVEFKRFVSYVRCKQLAVRID